MIPNQPEVVGAEHRQSKLASSCNKYFKVGILSYSEKIAVRQIGPTSLIGRFYQMAQQPVSQWSQGVMVEKDPNSAIAYAGKPFQNLVDRGSSL